MADYDLSGLSSRSFEKLVQALAGKFLGPGTVTFGDGPDGGREATFNGKMDFPSLANPWSGYCVIQAKFLQRPTRTRQDGQWALKQLENELEAFADPQKRRTSPDYYIFATNAVLTPVQSDGGKDKASRLFSKFRKRVPIKDWRIWDFDEIGKFLDSAEDIRRSYAAWITPGDVLAEVIKYLSSSKNDFSSVITNFLAKELRSDQFANLEQAGHTAEERIPLAHVFVDLPCTPERSADPPEEDSAERVAITELVSTLLERARDPFDSLSILESRSGKTKLSNRGEALPGRYVLVGGPGQGKTTVGQFACQLFRAALLQDQFHLLTQEVRDTVQAITDHCEPGKLEIPKARRFPIRIVLSDLASAINEDSEQSLLAYIARRIAVRTGKPSLEADDLRTWLSTYPWFIVFDGLDEVPPSTNREEVLRKIEEFWTDAAQVNADILVLATTRPQGYNDDFSPSYYQHLWLAPLSAARALNYARRLVDTRYAGEPDRQQKIVSRLVAASEQEATARLMRSPLQVTIMATLVDQIGNPPQDRWRLFHDYYDVIYKREQERRIPAAELLRDQKTNIDAIHHQIGLLLQVESEHAGGTDAKLSADRFSKVVTARLKEEGYSEQEVDMLRERIIEAAAHRLVFLVGLEAGQVGFEIRSLQEYMAAEELMSARELVVQSRLRRIAPITSWRNVFLFASGRCFAQQQQQHLRETISVICLELNDQLAGPAGMETLAGSVLALDLIEDGVARRQPRYARLLTNCAVQILKLPPTEAHVRLADICEGEAESIIQAEIQRALSSDTLRKLASWTVLLALQARRVSWAQQLLEASWNKNINLQVEAFSLPSAQRASGWLQPRLEPIVYANTTHHSNTYYWISRLNTRRFNSLIDLRYHRYKEGFELRDLKVIVSGLPLTFSVSSIRRARELAEQINIEVGNLHPDWAPHVEDVRFSRAPSKRNLAESLQRLAETAEPHTHPTDFYSPFLSWVFGACALSCHSSQELTNLSNQVADGLLGDLPEWLEAEERWRLKGIDPHDLMCYPVHNLPFTRSIAEKGFPQVEIETTITHEDHQSIWHILHGLQGAPFFQDLFAARYLFFDSTHRLREMLHPYKDLLKDITMRRHEWSGISIADAIAELCQQDPDWIDILDQLGRNVDYFFADIGKAANLRLLPEIFKDNTDRLGLLPLVATAGLRDPGLSFSDLPPVRFEVNESPSIRWATLTIEIVQGIATDQRADELLRSAASGLLDNNWRIRDLIDLLEHQERFDGVTENFLINLKNSLVKSNWGFQAQLTNALNNLLRRRSSGLGDEGVWTSLALPVSLLPLLAKP